MRILLLGDYLPDPRLGSSKVYYKLQDELTKLGHTCDLMLHPGLGEWPTQAKLRWALGPVLAARAVAARGSAYDVIDAASAEGAVLGVRHVLTPDDGTVLISRSHGLEHRNYQRLLDDHDAGLVRKRWHRRWWYPLSRLSQVALAARLADRLIVLNPGDAEYAVARGWKPREDVAVVPHGVSTRFLSGAPASDAARGAGLLFCGSWDDVKGVRYIADAFSIVAASDRTAHLTVLGAGAPAEAVLASFAAHARGAVTVYPRVGEDEVMRQYRIHDGLVMASTYEGFGMVVIEAMSQRLPVIATPVGCVPGLIRDGENGLLVRPRSAAELAAAMQRLLRDRELRVRVAEAAFPLAASHTWARTAETTLNVYRAAVSGRRRAA